MQGYKVVLYLCKWWHQHGDSDKHLVKCACLQLALGIGSITLAAAFAFSILATPVGAVTNEQLLFLEVRFLLNYKPACMCQVLDELGP